MSQKNHIKIDSFKITRMYLNDIPEVLKLAISAQSKFGVTSTVAPSLFFREIGAILQKNTITSFVFRDMKDRIFAAFIISPITTASAEIAHVFVDSRVIQTTEMQQAFKDKLEELKYKEIAANVMKSRKRYSIYVKFLNTYGFNEIANDNDAYLKLFYRKS
jgi:hypothetical protein